MLDPVAHRGDAAEFVHQEAGEGLEGCLAGQFDAVHHVEVADGGSPFDLKDVLPHARGGLHGVELVFDLAKHLLEEILGGDHAADCAEFVDYKGDVRRLGPQIVQHQMEFAAFRHDWSFADDRTQVERRHRSAPEIGLPPLGPIVEHVFDVDDSDQILRAALVDRQARVTRFAHHLKNLINGGMPRRR